MTRTIQNLQWSRPVVPAASASITADGAVAARRTFLEHAATMFEAPLSPAQIDEFARLDDLGALRYAFPWMSDAEVNEVLWAFGAGTW